MERDQSTAVGVVILIAGAIGAMMFRTQPSATPQNSRGANHSNELSVLEGQAAESNDVVLRDDSLPPAADISRIAGNPSASEQSEDASDAPPPSPAPPDMPHAYGRLRDRSPAVGPISKYRDQAARMTPSREQRVSKRSPPRESHVIRDGDTLETIALRYYGDSGLAQAIFLANREQLPSQTLLPVGVTLRLPSRNDLPRYSGNSSSSPPSTHRRPLTTLGSVR